MITRLKRNIPLIVALGVILVSTGLASPYLLGSLKAQTVKTRVLVIGDSIVAGQGDTDEFKGLSGRLNRGGTLHVETIGLPGATTKGLSMFVQHQLSRNSQLRSKVMDADVIILSSGLNDFWSESGPKRTASNLRRLIKTLRCATQDSEKKPKKFAITTLAPTTLPAQFSWSGTVNTQIVQFPSEEVFVGPRLHELPKSLLGEDGIHPSPEGYAWIAEQTRAFITKLPAALAPTTLECTDRNLLGPIDGNSQNEGATQKRKRSRRPTKAAV